jgi:class 3 adenylate cyclase
LVVDFNRDMSIDYRYKSLEDYLISNPLTVDGKTDDAWGASFPVKGIEIDATILYSDISRFSARTLNLSSTEILIFVNNFFAWITAEALRETHGIVDKYIGDEIMIVFSKEFGSEDPFQEAIQAARWMSEHDALAFCPHIGIASGRVTIGYIGTPVKYSCSVFGTPVTFANRCTSVKPYSEDMVASNIVFPASEWKNRELEEIIPPVKFTYSDGLVQEMPLAWELLEPRTVNLKNIGNFEVQELVNKCPHVPMQTVEERVKGILEIMRKTGHYRPSL